MISFSFIWLCLEMHFSRPADICVHQRFEHLKSHPDLVSILQLQCLRICQFALELIVTCVISPTSNIASYPDSYVSLYEAAYLLP